MHFLCGHLKLSLAFFADSFHRDWNSVKLSAQRSSAYLWGSIVQLTVVFNLSRAPWASSQFWRTKQDSLAHLVHSGVAGELDDDIGLVATELGLPPPRTPEEYQAVVTPPALTRGGSHCLFFGGGDQITDPVCCFVWWLRFAGMGSPTPLVYCRPCCGSCQGHFSPGGLTACNLFATPWRCLWCVV
jgi:hypothetical protein